MIGRAAGERQGGPAVPAATRLGPVDELTCCYDSAAEPANVHIEVWLPGRLDLDAFGASVLAVLAARPRARARRRAASRWLASSYWEYPPVLDADPVQVTAAADEAEIARWRAGFLSAAPSLDSAPPVRFLLVRGPDGDRVMLNAHHAVLDGLSCLELLRAVAAGYGGQSGPGPGDAPHGSAWLEDGPALAGAAPRPGGLIRRPAGLIRRPAGLVPRPAVRIAGRLDAGQHRNLPGYGACLISWDGLAAVARQLRAMGGSVNDLLIAAMIATIGGWNSSNGGRAGRVMITMPVGDRAMTRVHGMLGHTSRLATVTARPAAGMSCLELIGTVSQQTSWAKEHRGPQLDPASRLLAAAPLPVPVRRCLLRAGLRTAGSWLCDTSLVSNLGVIGPLRFGQAVAGAAWFSTSAHMPRGLSLGAVTVGGRLHLTFRYRHALFGEAAAAEFAGRYRDALNDFAGAQL